MAGIHSRISLGRNCKSAPVVNLTKTREFTLFAIPRFSLFDGGHAGAVCQASWGSVSTDDCCFDLVSTNHPTSHAKLVPLKLNREPSGLNRRKA